MRCTTVYDVEAKERANIVNELARRCRIGKVTRKPVFPEGFFAASIKKAEYDTLVKVMLNGDDCFRPPIVPSHGVMM